MNRPNRSDDGGCDAPAHGCSDGLLARRIAEGDREAAAELVHRYQPIVRGFLRGLTRREDLADDLAQETFLRVLRSAHRYDPTYPMRTWLLTIARRLSINDGRSRGRERGLGDGWRLVESRHERPDEAAGRKDEQERWRQRLASAMAELTEAQRQAVLLFHQQELPVTEVARIMDLPTGTVKSHLHRARAALRKILS